MEIWLGLEDFPDYEVSSEGRVRNRNTMRILKSGCNQKGYRLVCLHKNGKQYTKKVHRLVADRFYDGDHSGLIVNHIDGNKENNFIGNLEWCTTSHNAQHAYDMGLRVPPRRIRVRIIETGNIYESMSDCARAIGGNVRGISDCFVGRQKAHRGYHFDFSMEGCRQ